MKTDDRPEYSKRLEKARIERGFRTAKEAATFFGWSYDTYVQHENGTRGIGRVSDKYAKAFRVSEAWLLTGEGRGPNVDGDKDRIEARRVRVKGYVQAGYWAETWELPYEDQYDVPVPSDEFLAPYTLYAAETRGPSMNQRYPEGTVLVFTDAIETNEDIQIGKRYVVERERVDGMREATVKTLWCDEANKLWLVPESDDPRFQEPLAVDSEQEDGTIRIIGRIRYAVSRE